MTEKKAHGYWKTRHGHAEIRKAALQFATRTEFRKHADAIYQAAHNQGLLDEVCAHMLRQRRARGYWNSEAGKAEIREKALLCSQRSEFEERFNVEYNAALRLKIIDDACSHMTSPQRKSGFWKSEEGRAEVRAAVAKCENRKDFRERFRNHYDAARKHGYLEEVCADLEYVFYPAGFWDSKQGVEEMKFCVAQCETLDEFRSRFSRAYNSAKKKGLLDGFADELQRQRTKKGFWDTEVGLTEINIIAQRYKQRSDFKYERAEVYLAARRRGVLDDVCKHMVFGGVGFNSAAKGNFYVLSVIVEGGLEVFKIGITNHSAQRRYKGEKANISFVHEWEFEHAANALDAETTIKRILEEKRYKKDGEILSTGGDTELFSIDLNKEITWISGMLADYAGVQLY